ncbi:beta-galactosidase trimerization domain-containing protein [Streptosporangium lutulentum]
MQAPGLPSAELSYPEAVRQAHRVLYRHGVTADFAHPSADLSAYGLVLVPGLYLITDADAANLRRYVEGGGTLLVSYLSGVADEHARVRRGGYPGALRDLLGVRVEEFHPLPPDLAIPLSVPGGGPLRAHTEDAGRPGDERLPSGRGKAGETGESGERQDTGTFWSEHVHLRGAEALALYTGSHPSAAALSGVLSHHP